MLSIILILLKLAFVDLVFISLLYICGINLVWSIIIGIVVFWGLYFLYRKFNLSFQKYKLNKISSKFNEDVKIIEKDGVKFRDLNKNGKLDIYEDPRRDIEERVEDLLSQMTVDEKAGLLFNHFTFIKDANQLVTKQDELYGTYPQKMIYKKNMNTFTLFGGEISPKQTSIVCNKLQKMAEKTRLGIPVTIATDPRHHYDAGVGTGASQEGISRWPEQLGLAATRNKEIVEQCGQVIAKELRAQGIHMLLGPMADVATSPMWGRNYGTFGEHFDLTSEMVSTFIKSAQGKFGKDNILCQVKHFPGGGPQKDGWDSHFPYGKEQIYPANKFEDHLKPFKMAIDNGVSQIMPYYSIPKGLKGIEEVGFNFNKAIINDLLREKLNFNGVIATDFSIIIGTKFLGFNLLFPKDWGVEHLRPIMRLQKAFDAGIDQFGGETCSNLLAKLVNKGDISEERLNESCKRVLRDKFKLGLFENPFVDVSKVDEICGTKENIEFGAIAQEKSYVLLKNGKENPILPLKKGVKIFCSEFSKESLKGYAELVDNIEEADIAIIRKAAPHIKQHKYIYEKLFKQGRLDFPEQEKQEILSIMKKIPTVLDLGLDRPVVFPEINEKAEAVLGCFGCEEEVFVKILFGEIKPEGKLPLTIPKSMDIVYAHKVDSPLNREEALYPYGYGLTY